MKHLIAVVFAVFLYVDKPVASLQFDLDTAGKVTLDSSITYKQLVTSVVNGKVRVLIYGLNQTTFSGRFAEVSSPVASISNIVAADPDANQVQVSIKTLHAPANMQKK